MLEMTAEQKYNEVLKELGALLADKNTTISCQRWQIDQLKEKLEAAERERDEARKAEQLANKQLETAEAYIATLKGGVA